jgi:hypothetical protein
MPFTCDVKADSVFISHDATSVPAWSLLLSWSVMQQL